MGDVWDRTTRFLSDHAGATMALALPLVFLPTVLQALLVPAAAAWPAMGYALSLLNLLLSIVSLWGQLAVTALALMAVPAPGPARRLAGQRLLPALGIVILLLAVLSLTFVPAVAILSAKGADLSALAEQGMAAMPEEAAGPFGLYSLIWSLLCLFVLARLLVLFPVVLEERRGLRAFGRSWRLTHGLSWRLFGTLLLFLIVASVAVMAVQSVAGTVLALLAGGEGPFAPANIVTPILVAAVSTAFTVLALVFTARLYLLVRLRAEQRAAPAA
ncbi:hypothetical protein [Sphingomonas aracearum]|uniref:Glycerophosphoryl diester phosphodiesterase membrane domain-containing protein n=1 Tax=Sphingomonas aracearum TaxID=2283317 RepID=A0A369W0Z4_9SPHN|nr:hypothetical protein [Sphingomonas aracearum]RDE05751.1 hypothetical protein DVW87_11150 [Sphingomonas aracearum]